MRTYTTRTTTRLALVLTLTSALFAAGCGAEKAQDGIGEAWREGYPPVELYEITDTTTAGSRPD